MSDDPAPMKQSERRPDRAEAALLKVLGFSWSDAYGVWVGPEYTRFDSLEDALDEACATAEIQELRLVEDDA